MFFALHKILKTSACVTEIPKKAGDSSRYAGDREKGLKILRLPPNAGELTAMQLVQELCQNVKVLSYFFLCIFSNK